MKKSFVAAISGVLAGAAILLCATPAMAGVSVMIGIPVPVVVAPAPYIGPPVVYGGYGYGGYGPVVQVGGPYYYGRGWHEHRHGYYDRGRREGRREGHHEGHHEGRR